MNQFHRTFNNFHYTFNFKHNSIYFNALIANSKVCFITNNVKGLQSSKKRSKFIKHLKDKLQFNRLLFLQETHSVSDDENAWADDFKGQVFLSQGTSDSRGVFIAYLSSKSFVVNIKRNDDAGRILILDVTNDDLTTF